MARDGTLVADVPPYRRVAAMLFARRNDSTVYLDETADVTETLPWIDRWNSAGRPHMTLFLLMLHSLAKTLHRHPRLNRFVAAGRLYQRDGVSLSFTAKRSMDPAAHLVVVKRRFEAEESLEDFTRAMEVRIEHARSRGDPHADTELSALLRFPHALLRRALRLAPWVDEMNLLPASFVREDPFFTSAFLTNLGSVGGGAGYHHLYEYGNAPLFLTLGRVGEEVVAREGKAAVRTLARMRVTFDERVEDGFNAVRALTYFRELLERPAQLAGE